MTIYNWLCLFGVPSLIGSIFAWCKIKTRKNEQERNALKLGVQAMLRNELIKQYKTYMKQGYADYDDKENWINLYNQYHTLGVNGVMDKYKDKVLSMPDE